MSVFTMPYFSDWNIGHIFKIDDRCQLLLNVFTDYNYSNSLISRSN